MTMSPPIILLLVVLSLKSFDDHTSSI